MPTSKLDRLAKIFRRLQAWDPPASKPAALRLLEQVMNEVEDEFSDVPFDPANWQNDGRLYPPHEDSARPVEGRADLTRYRSKRHNTFIRSNGAIEIRTLNGTIEFSKPGADGHGVDL